MPHEVVKKRTATEVTVRLKSCGNIPKTYLEMFAISLSSAV